MKTIGLTEIKALQAQLQHNLAAVDSVVNMFGGSYQNGDSEGGVAVARKPARTVTRILNGVNHEKRAPETQMVEEAIRGIKGDFRATDVNEAVENKFPNEEFGIASVPNTLNKLTKAKVIKAIVPKSGRRGAIYRVL